VVGFFGELLFRMFTNVPWSSGRRSSSSSSSSSSDRDSKGAGGAILAIIIAVALILLAWLLSQVVKLALSRSREFLADAGSVELTKNPDAMISALRKIENRGELPGATSAVMELCVDNPREGFADLFATHPSVENRVKALVKFAGGHDPGPLALPPDEPRELEDQQETPPDQLPPPVPRGPWSDANSPATGPADARSGPSEGPWGRRG
jgi:heat shock protein HtpX